MSDAPEKFSVGDFPVGTTLHHRSELDAVQRELRELPGVTVLIYEQACATEKRRRRKRGQLEDPARHVVINDLVCEGCGDCSVESNCLSVVPKETHFGRKRQIDQNSCNKDFSCLNGFCPSFVTVEGGRRRRPAPKEFDLDAKLASLPRPTLPTLATPWDVLVTGVGGTGVITVGQLITMAAHLEGKDASVLDFMGFAQKFGPVLSYIRLGSEPEAINQVRIAPGTANALVGCDLVVSSSPKASATYSPEFTQAVVNSTEMATADFVLHRDANLRADDRIAAIADACRGLQTLPANRIAEELMGDSIYANVVMLGMAWQQGLIPVSLEAIKRAIELNGVKVNENKAAFSWGRIGAVDLSHVEHYLAPKPQPESLDEQIERRRDFLVGYQNQRLASRYSSLVERVRLAESKRR